MKVNVKGRNIQIDDKLAEKFKLEWNYQIDQKDILIYVNSVYHGQDANKIIEKLSDQELTELVERCMKMEV